MATGFKNLDRHLDRLEKLFSRKKKAAEPHDSAAFGDKLATPIPFLTGSDATSRIFPQPSFIRPTSSRMMAREEVLLTSHFTRRSKSLPDSPSTPCLTAPAFRPGGSRPSDPSGSDLCPSIPLRFTSLGPGVPQRTSSLTLGRSKGEPLPELLGFTFPDAPREADVDSSKRRSRSDSRPLTRSTSVSVSPKARVDRKRHSTSARDDLTARRQREAAPQRDPGQYKPATSVPSQRKIHGLGAGSRARFASPISPRLVPLPEPGQDELVNDNNAVLQKRPRSMSISGVGNKHIGASLRKSTSLSKLSTTKLLNLDPILKEPSVTDFLTLSDDDIADGIAASRAKPPASNPPAFALPPNPPPASTPRGKPGRSKSAHPLLTLSPPLASRPAAAAALEAARIATKYRFDLVYVVNLWPSHMSRPSRSSPLNRLSGTPVNTSPARASTPFSPESPVSRTPGYDGGFEARVPRSGMTGRLLAAYGLPSIMYPFRISAPVHQKVLRIQGWLEYRGESGALNEFSRGYSCSFYTGHSPARRREAEHPSATPNGTQRNAKPKPANRGIVFAAFRLPRSDGTPCCSDAEELEALHWDAEALVDMLIEIRMTQRQRRPLGSPRRCVTSGNDRLVRPGAPLVTI